MPPRLLLAVVLCIAAALFLTGITWGLPSSKSNHYLFGDHPVMTGQEIVDLAGGWDTNSAIAADKDRDPLGKITKPVLLNGTDRARAEIVRRYRLFSSQPDEMITFRALSQMNPGEGKLDPKLYQYGGLWMYPVGAMLKGAAMVKYVDLRSDVAFYLDNPEAFGRFYVVARLYSVMWGLAGVAAVWAIVRRLTSDKWLASLAGLGFAAMPVVITMAHEAKPHLAGAVLMLWAGYAAIRYLDFGTRKRAMLVGLLCGCATAMVPTSAPVFLLLPVLMVVRRKGIVDLLPAGIVGVLVYAITNPYVVIHLLGDRTILTSGAGNTADMYRVSAPLQGLWNVMKLTVEGAGWVVVVGGVVAWLSLHFAAKELRQRLILLAVPAIAVFAIFAAFGAGKPGEYGRFLIVPNAVLLIGLFVAMRRVMSDQARTAQAAMIVLVTAIFGFPYWIGFARETILDSRLWTAGDLKSDWTNERRLAVYAEPAPYCQPPVNVYDVEWWLTPAGQDDPAAGVTIRVRDVGTRISWANKPFEVTRKPEPPGPPRSVH